MQNRLNAVIYSAQVDDDDDIPLAGPLRRRSSFSSLHSPSAGRNKNRQLVQAAYEGDLHTIRGLIYDRANVNYRSEAIPVKMDGMAPIHAAVISGHLSAVRLLLENNANVNLTISPSLPDRLTALHIAVTEGHVEIVRFLIKYRVDVNAVDSNGQTPLFKSMGYVTQLLLQAGAKTGVKDHSANTALHFAANAGLLDSVQELVRYNASGRAQNKDGRTPLWCVCNAIGGNVRDRLGIIASLGNQDGFQAAVLNEAARGSKETALHVAIRRQQWEIVQTLLRYNPNVAKKTADDQTALHYAVEFRGCPLAIIAELVSRFGLDGLESRTKTQQRTALHIAVEHGCIEIAEYLLKSQRGVNVNSCTLNNFTALHLAAQLPMGLSSDMVRMLIYYKAKPSCLDTRGRTALFLVLHDPDTIDVLVACGGSVHATDILGQTPLFYLAFAQNSACVKRLLVRGASIQVVDRKNRTALENLCATESAWTNHAQLPTFSTGDLSVEVLNIMEALMNREVGVSDACLQSVCGWKNKNLAAQLYSLLPKTQTQLQRIQVQKTDVGKTWARSFQENKAGVVAGTVLLGTASVFSAPVAITLAGLSWWASSAKPKTPQR